MLYTSGTFDGDNALMLAAGVGLFLAQGVYLVYRGARQLAVASGSLVRARVLSAKAQTTGDNPENRSLTFVLELEVEAPDASDENGRVVALSTNVFTKPTADGCVGRTISVLWTPRFPTDAVAFPTDAGLRPASLSRGKRSAALAHDVDALHPKRVQ